MLDTVVLIVRKKNLKFLHVYHHVTILFVTWYDVLPMFTRHAYIPAHLSHSRGVLFGKQELEPHHTGLPVGWHAAEHLHPHVHVLLL